MKRTAIRRVSLKRAKLNQEYTKVRRSFLASHPVCQVCKKKPSRDVHHTHGRIGKLLVIEELFLAVCRPCHDYIHAHPSWARENGLLK